MLIKLIRAAFAAALILLSPWAVAAEEFTEQELEAMREQTNRNLDILRFWNACEPVGINHDRIRLYATDEELGKLGLPDLYESSYELKQVLQQAANKRLNKQHLLDSYPSLISGNNGLFLDVVVIGTGYIVRIRYNPGTRIRLHEFGLEQYKFAGPYVAMWETVSSGLHYGDASLIVRSAVQRVDYFIEQYLRVNAEDCT